MDTAEKAGSGAIPTYAWDFAPDHLLTRSQLRARGLRPGGADPVAQLEWRSWKAHRTGGRRRAWLYDARAAVPVRPMTPGRARALAAAMAARRTCTACATTYEFCLPTSLGGVCPGCAAAEEAAVLAAFAAAA
ncbi:RRQRL motif-containing zinc-binding protein [Nocardiopsis composta]|uniref:Uncharacterized protein n=1 Tax=Nocardiopsis composta TaxID=157465 RepID=A0A7W8QUP5_9ACTN|nr:RRQRL motif-containing zinc-binding protein [Nocardiopsis composta]MBB5436305.1 hypothetical protein [Nocardiopsis composta]